MIQFLTIKNIKEMNKNVRLEDKKMCFFDIETVGQEIDIENNNMQDAKDKLNVIIDEGNKFSSMPTTKTQGNSSPLAA